MSPADRPKGSLSQAHERIEGLMDELESTLELVKRLSESGEEEAALRLIDRQRSELYTVVNSLSRDVAVRERRWAEAIRRHVSVLAAAVVAALSTVAVSVGAFRAPPDPIADAAQQITAAEDIADPEARLTRIITVYRVVTQTVPERSDEVADAALVAIEGLKDDIEDGTDPDDDNADLMQQAEQAAEDISEGRPPAPPSTDESPVDTVRGLVPED